MITFNSIGLGRTIGDGNNNLYSNDFQISVNSTNGIVILNLPPINDVLQERFRSGYLQLIAFLIADISGTAATNKTTIVASSGELINGVSTIDLNTNNYSAILTITSDKDWALVSGISSGSPLPPSIDWLLNGNSNGSEKSIGTLDNFDFPIIVNGNEVGRFTTDKRLFLGDTKTNNGSNNGLQYSSLIANRAGVRTNQYGANNSQATVTSFKSRGLIIGEAITPANPSNNVQAGDILQGFTAIGLTDNGAGVGLIPLAYTQRVIVVQNSNGSVACDWEVSLCPLSGTTNSIRKAFGFTSEGIQKTLETANGMSGLAVLDATGTAVISNTNVKASTKFMLTVQDGGAVPAGVIYIASRVNGTSFTIKSNIGFSDAGVEVYYQLYEPIV
jgi:hypothetical protein